MSDRKISIKVVYLVVILIAALITLGTLLYLRFTTTEGIILKDDLVFDFREEVYVSDIVSYIDGSLVDDYKLDTSVVGIKDVVITFKNKYGFIVGKSAGIEIRDVTSPMVVVNDPYVVYVGSDIKLEDSIFCADDYDDNVKCNIVGEYDLNKIGSYELEMVAIDYSGNVTNKHFTLKVLEKKNSIIEKDRVEKYTSFKNVYNKYKSSDTLVGLDISKWQGDVDYSKLKNQGVSFVMLKIGGQTEIGGEFIIDPKFYDNISEALLNGIKVGVYFYSYAKSSEEAVRQADFVIDKLDNYDIDMPIVFDWENWSEYNSFNISFNTLNKIARSFINRVEEFGYKGVLYSSKYYLENIWYEDLYDNWIAYYSDEFLEYKDYYMWQMCSDGKIDGINGYVDIDVMYVGK